MNTEQIESQPDIRTLPLWKDWIDRNEHRIAYGLTVTMEEMEQALDGIRETAPFNMVYPQLLHWACIRGVMAAPGQ